MNTQHFATFCPRKAICIKRQSYAFLCNLVIDHEKKINFFYTSYYSAFLIAIYQSKKAKAVSLSSVRNRLERLEIWLRVVQAKIKPEEFTNYCRKATPIDMLFIYVAKFKT